MESPSIQWLDIASNLKARGNPNCIALLLGLSKEVFVPQSSILMFHRWREDEAMGEPSWVLEGLYVANNRRPCESGAALKWPS
jgi:hypothetical protein